MGPDMHETRDFPGLTVRLGFQDDGNGGGFWLFNLEQPIPGHPVGSTVSEQTLRAYLDSRSAPLSEPSFAPGREILAHPLPQHGETR